MLMIIKYLMYKMNSVDGTKDTAAPLFLKLYNRCLLNSNVSKQKDTNYL